MIIDETGVDDRQPAAAQAAVAGGRRNPPR